MDTQLFIERSISDMFSSDIQNSSQFVAGVNLDKVSSPVVRYLIDQNSTVEFYIGKLLASLAEVRIEESMLMLDILHSLDLDFIRGYCYYIFLICLTCRHTDDDDKLVNLIKIAVKIGKEFARKHFLTCFELEFKGVDFDKRPRYSIWFNENIKVNPKYTVLFFDDRFYSVFGAKLVEILEYSHLLRRILIKPKYNESYFVLDIYDTNLLNVIGKHKVLVLPTKLPMVVKPRPYSPDSLGGYLVNDAIDNSDIIIDKKGYAKKSVIKELNTVYQLVNGVSQVPFKVNTALLDFIFQNSHLDLLMDIDVPHKFENIEKRSKYQDKVYKSHNSKILLQETILEIVDVFRNFPEIYFPVRLDNRGRLYCSSTFFNYQSNDLAKALILFAIPGVIERSDLHAILYLKAYGANCFGGDVSKKSSGVKVKWVDDNLDNIINYDNGILLSKAKNKLLFLSFCMEFKRFYEFYTNDQLKCFHSYLPIQLDATCNGFQHLALLSNENVLYDVLNLTCDNNHSDPRDFYSFILHMLVSLFKSKIDCGVTEDIDTLGSYSRLLDFLLIRSYIKKAIMTIPYNATLKSMIKYIKEHLELVGCDELTKVCWYCVPNDSRKKVTINDNDIVLMAKCINNIIFGDFEKIRRLAKYLKNVATLFNKLNLPISWTLPSGLDIFQSYRQKITVKITPFAHRRITLNLRVTNNKVIDTNKQIRALMPNLIHSLDAASLAMLYSRFSATDHGSNQFFSVHDCFAVTANNVSLLKTILANVYITLYSEVSYIHLFDRGVIETIERNTEYKVINRTVALKDAKKPYRLHDIDWVFGKKLVSNKVIRDINSQYLVI